MYLLIFITAVLVFASVTDIRNHRVPNWLTFSGMVVGLASYFLTGGFGGLLFSAEGLILGFALLIPFYMAGGMGAGDVKLLAAVGALLGPFWRDESIPVYRARGRRVRNYTPGREPVA